eukprot:scaffold12379_cov99-Skeletonema_marinoi.AAC.2
MMILTADSLGATVNRTGLPMNTMTPLLLFHKAVEGSVVLSKTSVKRIRRGELERGKVVGSFEVIFFVFVKDGQK